MGSSIYTNGSIYSMCMNALGCFLKHGEYWNTIIEQIKNSYSKIIQSYCLGNGPVVMDGKRVTACRILFRPILKSAWQAEKKRKNTIPLLVSSMEKKTEWFNSSSMLLGRIFLLYFK